jgi:hypothetical protein
MYKLTVNMMKKHIVIALAFITLAASCGVTPKQVSEEKPEILSTQPFEKGTPISIEFVRGGEYYHPLVVFWIEDVDGNYVETIYAARSIATGTFRYGVAKGGEWQPGERRRSAALPFWGHRRGIKAPDGLFLPTPENPLPDAITGATPRANFEIKSSVKPELTKFYVYMEINQTWDWNHHWHNNLFPDDEEYKTSCQPSLVYRTLVDLQTNDQEFELQPVGHGHPSGKSGELFSDISTFTTALQIAERVIVRISELD